MPAARRSAISGAGAGAIGGHVVDAGGAAVGADADMILAADVHRMLDMGDDVRRLGDAVGLRNGMK